MKRIIVLNDFPIYPPNHGGKIRIYNIYKRLSKEYFIIYLCFGNDPETTKTYIKENFIEIRVPKSHIQKIAEFIAAKALGIPADDITAMILGKYNSNIKRTLRYHLNDCDIVVLSHPYMFPIIESTINSRPIIYESHNVEYSLKKNMIKKKLIKNLFTSTVRNLEGRLISKSHIVFTTSSSDGYELKKLYNLQDKKLYISPNGTNVEDFADIIKNSEREEDKPFNNPVAIFIGSAHAPNIEAVRTIIEQIAPCTSGIHFLICGSVCRGLNTKNLSKNISLTFEITDGEKLKMYRTAAIALNPMLSGSGTNLKMLEYMASGIPIITTPIGSRGIDIEDQNHALICDISEFPERIYQLISDPELSNKLRYNALKLVKEKYDWEIIAENMAYVFRRL